MTSKSFALRSRTALERSSALINGASKLVPRYCCKAVNRPMGTVTALPIKRKGLNGSLTATLGDQVLPASRL